MTLSDALILIDEIRKQKYKPNEWESNFMQSIELSNKGRITDRQGKCLNRIYEKSQDAEIYQRRQYI